MQKGTRGGKLLASRARVKNVPQIDIDLKKCTGCGFCVEFCNRGVLALQEGHVVVVGLDKCTECRLCEIRCPEPAILVIASDG